MRFFRRLVVNLEDALARHGIPYRLQKTWSRMYLETPEAGDTLPAGELCPRYPHPASRAPGQAHHLSL